MLPRYLHGGLAKALRVPFLLPLLLAACCSVAAQTNTCQAPAAIRAELQQAESAPVADPTAVDKNIAPFQALRQRHPSNLFVHERYQDAVEEYGIEGHLRVLTQEYQSLATEHADDVMYAYLSARSLIGRSTPSAVSAMNDLLSQHPDFALAHRMLVEIYESDAFRDAEKAAAERNKLQALCPGATLAHLPVPLPSWSPLIEQAGQLLQHNGDPARVADMALQGTRKDEWRLQRIRPFDWYSVEFKRAAQDELQTEYWKLWSVQVRCFDKTGQPEKAKNLLATMEDRASRLGMRSPQAYWDAETTLARLYIDEKQLPLADQKIQNLSQLLDQHADPSRVAQLEELKKLARP